MVSSTNQGGRFRNRFLVIRISGLYITEKIVIVAPQAFGRQGQKEQTQHFETALKRKRTESAVSQKKRAGQNPWQ